MNKDEPETVTYFWHPDQSPYENTESCFLFSSGICMYVFECANLCPCIFLILHRANIKIKIDHNFVLVFQLIINPLFKTHPGCSCLYCK